MGFLATNAASGKLWWRGLISNFLFSRKILMQQSRRSWHGLSHHVLRLSFSVIKVNMLLEGLESPPKVIHNSCHQETGMPAKVFRRNEMRLTKHISTVSLENGQIKDMDSHWSLPYHFHTCSISWDFTVYLCFVSSGSLLQVQHLELYIYVYIFFLFSEANFTHLWLSFLLQTCFSGYLRLFLKVEWYCLILKIISPGGRALKSAFLDMFLNLLSPMVYVKLS